MPFLLSNTDDAWECFGAKDPYYGVLTSESFRTSNIGDVERRDFFDSGRRHVLSCLAKIEALVGPVRRGGALDFGCGVGRLALPLASDAGFVLVDGVDISVSMLREARANAERMAVENVGLIHSSEFFESSDQRPDHRFYSFIHSFIVLQHIPTYKGYLIFRSLLDRLEPGGVIAVHFPYFRSVSSLRKLINYIRVRSSLLHMAGNLLQRRPLHEPPMQMNRYDMNELFLICHEFGLGSVSADFLIDSGNHGVYLIGRRQAGD
jgi:2-polyprenyl-3-methyl-5-hydroxy-6-metoxy-1,4-benzoquinol methylase